jgi:16S rRNA (guanine527-N7)-methyltransferase
VSSQIELDTGLTAIPFAFPDQIGVRLIKFRDLLAKWNRAYNLTAIRDPAAMVAQHLLDSLAVLPAIRQLVLATRRQIRLADIGSGAGLPGIPLALALPDWQVTLIETVDKKSAFQRQAKAELGLENLAVINGRVEQVEAGGFDLVISRAFSELADFVTLAGHLIVPGGFLLAMKGVMPNQEIADLPQPWRVESALPIVVPGLDAQRHLIVLRKQST